MHTLRRIAILTASTLALAPAAASADTFCVHSPPNCNGTAEPDLPAALSAANINGAGTMDTIEIGVGLFNDPVATDLPGNPVTIEGVAVNQTALTTGTSTNAPAVLRIHEPTSIVRHLRVHTVSPNIPTGLELAGKATDVLVTNGGGAPVVDGVKFVGTQGQLNDSAVDLFFQNNLQNRAVFATTGTDGDINDSYLSAAVGVSASGGDVHVARTRFVTSQGLSATFGSQSTIVDSQITTHSSPTNFQKLGLFAGGDGSSKVTANRVTLRGDGAGYGVWVQPNGGANDGSVQLTSSIIDNYQLAFNESHPGANPSSIAPAYSAYKFNLTSGTVVPGAGNLNLNGVSPGFVNPNGGHLDLRYDSPLVDHGDPSYHPFLGFDLDFHARVIDGDGNGNAQVDMGALEYQHRVPVADAKANPTSATTGDTIAFDGTGSSDPDPGDTLTYQWSFDDGGSATGATAQHAFTSAGTHSATLTVTDPTGRTDTANVQVTFADPPTPPSDGGQVDPGTGDAGTGGDQSGVAPVAPGGDPVPTPKPKPKVRCKRAKRKHAKAHGRSAKKKKAKTTCKRKPKRKHHRRH
jgi:PKD repeat protein